MKVFLASIDLFSLIGGGQRFYTSLIRSNPDIDFYYPSSETPNRKNLPANAYPVLLSNIHRRNSELIDSDYLSLPAGYQMAGKRYDLAYLLDVASSVPSMSFDVLDVPDYLPFGVFLAECFRFHNVKIGRVALSLHGTLSAALIGNWKEHLPNQQSLINYEKFFFQYADVRYGISERYAAQWSAQFPLPIHLIDPGFCIAAADSSHKEIERSGPAQQKTQPDLCFVGRQDKLKGPDLFLEICSRLPRDIFRNIRLVGPEVNIDGHSSTDALDRLAKHRQLTLTRETIAPNDMFDWLSTERMVVFATSRYDTFNLAVLESLMAGCPTIVSIACGACDYLDRVYPGIPYIRLDPDNISDSYEAIANLLENYDDHRVALRCYLRKNARPVQIAPHELREIYEAPGQFNIEVRKQIGYVFSQYREVLQQAAQRFGNLLAERAADRFNTIFDVYDQLPLNAEFVAGIAAAADRCDAIAQNVPLVDDKTAHDIVANAMPLFEDMVHGGDRINVYRILAEWERRRGNELLHATYQLRVARLSGRFEQRQMEMVADILARNGCPEVAKVARLMGKRDPDAIFDYLNQRARIDFCPAAVSFQKTVDYRGKDDVVISVIVSVYRGASKADTFVSSLERMTRATKINAEFIFVDSNSPDDTADVLPCRLEAAVPRGIRSLYVRTPDRETIQRAWNRGIDLARGRYLAFLGLDETVRPDALALMADFLDARQDIDWVQGSAVVTEVSNNGSYVRDVMSYDRSFDIQEIHSLECCHISYVGALYRKSIHDRFGYYDDSFGGAGDTEFKNRVLPNLNVETLPETLGTFLNYPEERTTQSPMAELEDLRAWYLFRTVGGIRYSLQSAPAGRAGQLFHKALHYRKSYMDRLCTDLDFAMELAEYIRLYRPIEYEALEQFVPALASLQQSYRRFDELTLPDSPRGFHAPQNRNDTLERIWKSLHAAQQVHQTLGAKGHYWITNDNRWHQHHTLWPSVSQRHIVDRPLDYDDLLPYSSLAELIHACTMAEHASVHDPVKAMHMLDLSELQTLDIVIPNVDGGSRENDALVSVLAQQSGLSILLIGAPHTPDTAESRHRNLYRCGPAREMRPLLAAARIIVFPALGNTAAMLESVVYAIGAAKPLILSRPVMTALENHYPGVDFSGIPVAEDPNLLLMLCMALCESAEKRVQLRIQMAALAGVLLASGNVASALRISEYAPPPGLVEWHGHKDPDAAGAKTSPASTAGMFGKPDLNVLLARDLTEPSCDHPYDEARLQQLFASLAAPQRSLNVHDLRWRYLFEPIAATESQTLPLLRFMLMVWQSRADLQKLYPLQTSPGRQTFALWCLLSGSREYRPLRAYLDETVVATLEQPASGLVPETDWDAILPRLLLLLLPLRPDLSAHFDIKQASGRIGFLYWYLRFGRVELALDRFPLPAVMRQRLEAKHAIGDRDEYADSLISGTMLLEYQARPDLREAFDLSEPAGLQGYTEWHKVHGIKLHAAYNQ